MEYLILTLEDLRKYQGQDFFYYCLWYLGSVEHTEYNVSRALLTQTGFIKRKPFNESVLEGLGLPLYTTPEVLKRRIKKIKDMQDNLYFDSKRGEVLIIVPLDVLYSTLQIIILHTETILTWGNLLKVWCYVWLQNSANVILHQATHIVQTQMADQIGLSRNCCSQALSNLIGMGLISRYGKYRAGSFGYCYKVAEQHAKYLKWYKNE